MIDECGVQHVVEVTDLVDDIGDMGFVVRLEHDDEFAALGLAVNLGAGQRFDVALHGLQACGTGMHDHAGNMNFP